MRRDPRELQKLERDLRVELRFVDLGAAPLRRLSPKNSFTVRKP